MYWQSITPGSIKHGGHARSQYQFIVGECDEIKQDFELSVRSLSISAANKIYVEKAETREWIVQPNQLEHVSVVAISFLAQAELDGETGSPIVWLVEVTEQRTASTQKRS